MFLLIDKPKGITSHDVVDEVRRITGEKRVGHAGTLDPNATGLLIVGVGRESTKKLGTIAKETKKVYVAELFLGEERETDDPEGRKLQISNSKLSNLHKIDKPTILKTLKSFTGKQEQIPPAYSAVKVKGKKAYELARAGKSIKLKPRKIMIYSIELLNYDFPHLGFEVIVSSGTYIRALARDIGRKISCGAYLQNLRRTRIGKFRIDNAATLSKLNAKNWKEKAIKI